MADVFDYAKYFMSQNVGANCDNFDGNMKLQKLLVFANLVSLAERDVPLFDEKILAFNQGCVIDKVRLRYSNDFNAFVEESRKFNPKFSQEEQSALDITLELFGRLSARELSEINHAFNFWYTAYQNSLEEGGYKDKGKAEVSVDSMRTEIDRFKSAIFALRETQSDKQEKETINGINFYYSLDDIKLTDDIIEKLYNFSLSATDRAYYIYLDNESLVIY